VEKLNFEEIKTERIPYKIVNQIKRQILEGKINPGEHLPTELELAEKLNVSRNSVREAFQILESLGIIERRKREGTIIRLITKEELESIYIPKPEEETLLDLLETREILEVNVVKLVVERASKEEINELEKILEWMKKDSEDLTKFSNTDIIFHITLARISQNQVIANIIHSLRKRMQNLQSRTLETLRIFEIIDEHQKIVDAIKSRNSEEAQKFMKYHLEKVKFALQKLKVRHYD